MKPRVCFVTPPSAFLLDERVFPNLGILKVAAALEACGYPVEHLDLDGVENYEDVARDHATATAARIFALTATTPQMPATARISTAIRAARADSHLILGGPHVTLAAAAMKKDPKGRGAAAFAECHKIAEVLVTGDGEDAIVQAVEACGHTPGLVYLDGDDPRGPLFLTRKRLEEVPQPARELIDLKSYRYTIDGVPATSMIAQLGCPFNCSFCGGRASPMLRRARMRSTESVLAEMEHLYTTYGYLGYMLYDDELNVNPKMVELMRGIVDLQKRLGVPGQFRLRGFVKSELVTKEQVEVMYEAGFRWLLCGFEAGHPRILENIQKKATVEDNDRCVELAHAAGLKVKALMSIGHAGESSETVAAVKSWLLRVKPEDFDCTIITPYPGSPYYDEAVHSTVRVQWQVSPQSMDQGIQGVWTYTAPKTGDHLHAFELDYMKTADYYKGDPEGGYRSYVFTDYLSPEDLVRERDALERDVRAALGIPFNPGQVAIRYEHSMGQAGPLPSNILRRSA